MSPLWPLWFYLLRLIITVNYWLNSWGGGSADHRLHFNSEGWNDQTELNFDLWAGQKEGLHKRWAEVLLCQCGGGLQPIMGHRKLCLLLLLGCCARARKYRPVLVHAHEDALLVSLKPFFYMDEKVVLSLISGIFHCFLSYFKLGASSGVVVLASICQFDSSRRHGSPLGRVSFSCCSYYKSVNMSHQIWDRKHLSLWCVPNATKSLFTQTNLNFKCLYSSV